MPVAFAGAILGEWFGSARGLGLLIVSAVQNFQIPLLWSAVIVMPAASLAVYGAMSFLERIALERYK